MGTKVIATTDSSKVAKVIQRFRGVVSELGAVGAEVLFQHTVYSDTNPKPITRFVLKGCPIVIDGDIEHIEVLVTHEGHIGENLVKGEFLNVKGEYTVIAKKNGAYVNVSHYCGPITGYVTDAQRDALLNPSAVASIVLADKIIEEEVVEEPF